MDENQGGFLKHSLVPGYILRMYMYIHQLCNSPTFCRQGFNNTRPELQGISAAQSTSESTTNDVHCVLNGTCTNVPWP